NLDRGPMWGIAVSGVYEHPKSWDMRDRFEMADAIAASTTAQSGAALLGSGTGSIGVFNPANWEREDFEVKLPSGTVPKNASCQLLEDGTTARVRAKLPAVGIRSLALDAGKPATAVSTKLPAA